MKIFAKITILAFALLCFSCSENISIEKIDSGFIIPAPSQTSDMKLLARSSTEDSLILTVNLKNAEDNSVIDNFTTTCVAEQLISVKLEAEKGDNVFVEISFSDINHTDLIWAYGKSDSFVLEDKETDISVELEYYDLAFYLTQNPFELLVTDKDGNEITKKSDSGNFVVKSDDELTVQISGLEIFGEVTDETMPYPISWFFNDVQLGEVDESGDFTSFSSNELSLNIGQTEAILPQSNILQAVIDITDVGKFNATFVFDVELN